MNREYLVNGFEFDSDLPGDYQIHPVTTIQVNALIVNGQCDLSSEIYAPPCKFVTKASLIGRFQKARIQLPMHFYCRRNDLSCYFRMK